MNKLKIVGICVVLVVIFAALVGIKTTSEVSVTFATPKPTPTPTPDPLAPKNVLMLGYGGGSHDGGLLTDTIMIAHVDPRARLVVLISLPRDLWVADEKINLAYAKGANAAKSVAEEVTGLPIDSFLAVSFEGFKSALSTLGPILVNVPYSYEDQFYPVDGKEKETCGKSPEEMIAISATVSGELVEREYICRFETLKFDKGPQKMDSDMALKFVRSRHSKEYPGDFYRSMRQQALIQGVIAKLKTIGGIAKIPALIPQISKIVATDATPVLVMDLLQRYSDPLSFQIKRISLTTENVLVESKSTDGQYVLIPSAGEGYETVKQYINSQFEQFKATPTASPSGL